MTTAAAPRVYVITDRHATGGRPLVEVVTAMLADIGAAASQVAIQLREKDLSGRALLSLARELRQITHAAGSRLFVNDRLDVALAADADGIHLPGNSLPPEDVRRIAPHLAIAVSTHRPDEVAAAAHRGVDFAVFGPVFDTPSKRAFGPPKGLVALEESCRHGLPVLALGGIDESNAGDCTRVGAYGISAIRCLMNSAFPGRVLRSLLPS